ncbi:MULTISPECIES: hypothetical protein [Winogradskyella]|uniref:hypothetical protein n=1 Tax=Winogradskyella TaxID=286104 RepID=UPI002356B8E0|nr:hypothetical protein [Winogradskyella sp.]
MFKSLDFLKDEIFFVLIGLFIVLVVFHSIAGYFEYDSDGSKIIVLNKGLLLTEYINYRERKLEFDRSELAGYKIKNFIIYKSLVLLVKKSNGKSIKERFNVTLVKKRKLKYVKQSLRKNLKENLKRKQG